MKRNFVVLYSPGTFIDETDNIEIDSWDITKAIQLSKKVVQRHGAKPYAFRFETVIGGNSITTEGIKCKVETKVIKQSGLHYIDGIVLTLKDIPDDREHSILRSNMKGNKWEAVVETRNSYRHIGIFEKDDVVVSSKTGQIIVKGSDYYGKRK